ncbi:related to amidases related to nicotinamidase [Phialocephala subalpina]|uniref:Related to amidases related to nicotinamidase n=1 Tax=Phialocephala subalpina TaxID=576137 RepID=A0A1L7X8U5_9HELO|nr:related to amidases related to nicotinamidase [Phialocephala subalpina]
MEGSIPYDSTRSPNTDETSPKIVTFSLPNGDLKVEKELPQSPKQNFPRRFLSGFTFKRTKSPRKNTAASATQFPDHKILQSLTISTLSLCSMDASIDAEPYKWPHDGTFDPATTALVIIDMQRDFCSANGYLAQQGYDLALVQSIILPLQGLLAAFRSHGFPVYHTREGHRPDLSTLSSRELLRSRNNPSGLGIGDSGPLGRLLVRGEAGHDIIPELYPIDGENIIDKPGRSAFQHTDFKLILNIKGIKNLILCGATTDVCVHSTMREANDNGFDCLIVEDCTAAAEKQLHDFAIESVKSEGGIFGAVTTAEKVLTALGIRSVPSRYQSGHAR